MNTFIDGIALGLNLLRLFSRAITRHMADTRGIRNYADFRITLI